MECVESLDVSGEHFVSIWHQLSHPGLMGDRLKLELLRRGRETLKARQNVVVGNREAIHETRKVCWKSRGLRSEMLSYAMQSNAMR